MEMRSPRPCRTGSGYEMFNLSFDLAVSFFRAMGSSESSYLCPRLATRHDMVASGTEWMKVLEFSQVLTIHLFATRVQPSHADEQMRHK